MSEAPGDTIQVAFNPFVGLRPFDEHEGYLFFGRDGQSDELVKRLGKTRFLAVVGVSGSGKSSANNGEPRAETGAASFGAPFSAAMDGEPGTNV